MAAARDQTEKAFDRHFEIVVSGSERTRGILYFLSLVIVVNIVFFFADAFDTAGRRMEIMNAANACLSNSMGAHGRVPLPGDMYDRHPMCDFFYDYIHDYYGIEISEPPVPADATATAFVEKYKASLRDLTDNLSTTVPILNIKIDRNDGLILLNTLGVIVLVILTISLAAERKSLVTAIAIAARNPLKLRAIADTHVFNRASAGRLFVFAAIFAPIAFQSYRIYQDIAEYKVVMDLYGPTYLALESFSLLLISVAGIRCFIEAHLLNVQLRRLG